MAEEELTGTDPAVADAPVEVVPTDVAGANVVPGSAAPVAPPPRPGALGRVFNWFWRGREMKQLRQAGKLESPAAVELGLRARLLFELAERARRPAEPLPQSGDAAAAELYRQSAYFGVRGLACARGADAESAGTAWAQLEPSLLQQLAGSPERVQSTIDMVEQADFREPWQLAKEQRALRADDLSRVARAVLGELAWRKRTRDALWIQRLLRIGLVVVVVAAGIFATRLMSDQAERARDLAAGKPWRTSSSAPGLGCTSPLQRCGENNDFFFHTAEQLDPWIEIDLGKPTRFTAVRVDNRRDCCFDRAVPLIIEVSNEQQGFREIARRSSSFSSWLATFPPTRARYVRVRVPARTVMHLAQIRVLR